MESKWHEEHGIRGLLGLGKMWAGEGSLCLWPWQVSAQPSGRETWYPKRFWLSGVVGAIPVGFSGKQRPLWYVWEALLWNQSFLPVRIWASLKPSGGWRKFWMKFAACCMHLGPGMELLIASLLVRAGQQGGSQSSCLRATLSVKQRPQCVTQAFHEVLIWEGFHL